MKNKNLRDTKHRISNALREAKEQKGLDYVEWVVRDDDMDYILNHYDVELLKHEIRRVSRRGISYKSFKSKLVRELYRKQNPVTFMELTDEQVKECRDAGLKVTPRVYRIRYRKVENSANRRRRRSGRRNIGKNGTVRR